MKSRQHALFGSLHKGLLPRLIYWCQNILWRVSLRWWWNIFQGSCVGIEAFVGSLCQFTIICSWENRGRRNHRCANGTPAWEVKVKYRVARKFAQFPGVFEKILTARKFSDFGEIEMAWKFAKFCEKTKAKRKFAQISEIFRENWGPTMWSKFSRTGGDCGWLLCGNPQFVSENFRPASKLVHPPVILSIAKIATWWNGYFQIEKKSYFIFSIAKITTIFTWKKCLIFSETLDFLIVSIAKIIVTWI